MSDKCYVIYVIHKNKATEQTEGINIISCVSTEEKAREFLQAEVDKHTTEGGDAEWFNEACVRIVDTALPFVHYITYQDAYNDLEEGIKHV